jgi:hypothetical protein
MDRILVGVAGVALAAMFGFIAQWGRKTGEAFSSWPYPPIRRETHPRLFAIFQWAYAAMALAMLAAGLIALLGLTP